MAILAKTRVPPGGLGGAFRHEIQQIDPDLPVCGRRRQRAAIP